MTEGTLKERAVAEARVPMVPEGSGRRRCNKRWGFVYAVEMTPQGFTDSENFVKLGASADPAARLDSLLTASPYPLIVHGVVFAVDARDLELELHALWKAARHEGEWFKRDRGILDYFREFTDPRTVVACNERLRWLMRKRGSRRELPTFAEPLRAEGQALRG